MRNNKLYGGKLAYHKYDNMITYWKKDGVGGLASIIRSGLGQHMTEVFDNLARNAYLGSAYALYGDGSGADFGDILSADTMNSEIIRDVRLGMAERGVPFTVMPDQKYQGANILCITTPGAIRDLTTATNTDGTEFVDVLKYAEPGRIIRGEVGAWLGVRFIETPRAILYNCGEITVQDTLAAAAGAGSGVAYATKVDGVRTVGQPSGVTNYLQLSAFAAGEYAVNDIITIHTDRTSDFGVTNGVDYRDGTLHNRRIESIDAGTDRITLDYPLMLDFTTDLGGGVYGYVTKGRHIHTSTFVGGMDGVVMGVGQMPRVYSPPPVDDFESMFRFSWDGFMKFQPFNPEVYEVYFHAGSNRVKGPRLN